MSAASIPPSFGLESNRNGRLEGDFPIYLRVLCVQRVDNMRGPRDMSRCLWY